MVGDNNFIYTFELLTYELPITVCGTENVLSNIGIFVPDMLLILFELSIIYNVITTSFKEISTTSREIVVIGTINSFFSLMNIVYRLAFIGGYENGIILYSLLLFLTIWNASLSYFFFPPRLFLHKSFAIENEQNNYIFYDTIIRAYFKLFLKDVLCEELYIKYIL